MNTPPDTDSRASTRPPYRPPTGLPLERQGRWGVPVSVLLHALLFALLLLPLLFTPRLPVLPTGGGPGAAGGGGGGRRGTGGRPAQERLQYIDVRPAAAAPAEAPVTAPPKEQAPKPEPPKPVPKPAVKPVAKPVVPPPPAAPAPRVSAVAPAAASPLPGEGGGSGDDGTNGAGPGTGGGVGAGIGPGRGNASGPGTGGGNGTVYPPVPDYFPLTPTRHPRLPGDSLVIYFTLDERGNVLRLEVPSTGDRQFDREMRERYAEVKFRPATKGDGTPVAGRFPVVVRF
ncbi:MAG TPA: hypothetical protein VF041_09995 [Gemmatimonadaceae bacterium]